MDLKRYQKTMFCPKCKSDLLTSDYIREMNLMKRRCSVCGYEEYQLPLDADEPG